MTKRFTLLLFALLIVGGAFASSAVGQSATQDLLLDSKLMGRKMPYRVLLPPDYSMNGSSDRYTVIYLLHGLGGHYRDWSTDSKLSDYSASHKYLFVMPEGEAGWYTDSATNVKDKYKSSFIKELIPEIDTKFRTIADRDHRLIAGLSMGGYGALKFGLKYPEMFAMVGSFSGALGAATYPTAPGPTENSFQTLIFTSLGATFGTADSETRKANDIYAILAATDPKKIDRIPYLYVACGTEDFIFGDTRRLDSVLIEKKIPHEYREHPGTHDWAFWDDQIREFLNVADRHLKK